MSITPDATGRSTPDPAIRHAEDARGGAFFIERDGARIAEMTYRRAAPGKIVIEHTEVSESLKGQGIAKKLVHAGVAWARGTHTRVVPVCPFARAIIERDPSLQDVC